MTQKVELTVHQRECDICITRADPETARHHQEMNLFLGRLNEQITPTPRRHPVLLINGSGAPQSNLGP